MKIKNTLFTGTLIALFAAIPCTKICAQKLPTVQTGSVKAPVTVKIDGDASEWEMRAYTHNTDFFYTVANDAENLYVVIRDTSNSSIQRIANGGVTFIFNSTDKKNTEKPVSITYPKIDGTFGNGVSYAIRTKPSLSEKDVAALNDKFNGHIKQVPISGIKQAGIAMEVNNDLGIGLAQQVKSDKVYAIELKLPLKYLSDLMDDNQQISYKLQVNGMDTHGMVLLSGHAIGDETSSPSKDEAAKNSLLADTYVNGTYILAKY